MPFLNGRHAQHSLHNLGLFTLLAFALLPAKAIAFSATDCREWLAEQDRTLREAGIRDAGAVRVENYPHLRVNRWLESLHDEVDTRRGARLWLQQAADEARRGWRAELTRLTGEPRAWRPRLDHCIGLLTEVTEFVGVPETPVPDNYVTWKRALGVYPVTRWLATPFIRNYHRDMSERMAEADAEPAAHYLPPPAKGRAPVPSRFAHNPLDVPRPSQGGMEALLRTYAPVLSTGADDRDNRPGEVLLDNGRPTVEVEADEGAPPAYHWASWTRFRGKPLLQLNYQFWFPRRPPQGSLDIYAGKLDSLIWRITLKPDGSVLFYDSIHSCGCYHKVFPVDPELEPAEMDGEQPVFAAHPAPDARRTRVELQLEADTHYLLRARPWSPQAEVDRRDYRFEHADILRRLPRGDEPDAGYASLYDRRGLIPASRRAERWLLWPLGIRSAGAMRQPGTHAIAFIGRRHFDDPDLPDRLFR